VPSSNPAFGIDTELPVALAVIGEIQAITNNNTSIHDPRRGIILISQPSDVQE
jgi:hypothetical protein